MKPEEFTDIRYEVEEDNHAVITIDRQERMNSCGRTVDELISAFKHAWADRRVAAVIFTAAGERAFCTGGDVKERAGDRGYGETEWGRSRSSGCTASSATSPSRSSPPSTGSPSAAGTCCTCCAI